jgi:hypothetical protein
MHGISSSLSDTFSSTNAVGQTIPTPNNNSGGVIQNHSQLFSSFTSTSVTGASAQLTFDVMVNGSWVDSGTPPVPITGSISGVLHGLCNHQIITAARVRPAGITGGSCAVNSRLVPFS